ncbi:ABC transporter permease [Pseudarthrobacter sp. NPDC089323]
MTKLIARRLLRSLPLLLMVSLITFILEAFIPGDPASTLLGANATPEQYAAVREALHLNEPLYVQYWLYLTQLFQGSLGTSIFTGNDVLATMLERLPVSLSIIVLSTAVAFAAGVALGVAAAVMRGPIARVVEALTPIGFALPNFWVGLVLSATFAVAIPLFPATGYVPFADSPSLWLWSLVLPVATIAVGGVATTAKVTRDGMLTALSQDYIRTLRACGVPLRSLVWRHALRNSGTRVVTALGTTFVAALSGTVLIESVFVLPGLGSLAVSATNSHDIPVVQGVALTFTVIVVIVNLLVDISYGVIDPRVKVS